MPITNAEELRRRVYELAVDEPNPYQVAADLLAELTQPEELRVIAEVTLSGWVAQLVKRPAPASLTPVPPTFADTNGNRRASARQTVTANDFYTRKLAASVKIGDRWSTLGACAAADLDWLAAYRRKKAAEDLGAAQTYEKLAAALREHGAATVADLDDNVGRDILT